MIKKLLSSIVAATVIAASVSIAAHGESLNGYPVVFLSGYSSTDLFENAGTAEERRVWPIEVDERKEELIESAFTQLREASGESACDLFVRTAGPVIRELFEDIALNPDGSSVKNVTKSPEGIEATRFSVLKSTPEYRYMKAIADKVGSRNLFWCTLDWRQGQKDCASVLDAYIKDVMTATGKSKVNLMGISFGAQVISAYLAYYGGNNIGNIVFESPASGGTSLVSQLLDGKGMDVTYPQLIRFLAVMHRSESEAVYEWILKIIDLGFIDRTLTRIINEYLFDIFVNFGSVWDLVPADEYTALRNKYLSDAKYDLLRSKSDSFHSECSSRLAEVYKRAREDYGVNISIVAGSGSRIITGTNRNSDGVIDVRNATGAICSEIGKRLKNTGVPEASGNYRISPSMDIDASGCFLPDNTWFVEGMLHGQGSCDDNVTALILRQLLANETEDVNSNPSYPQFMCSQNPVDGVYGCFALSKSGYLTKYDTVFTVKNLSNEHSITIRSINGLSLGLFFGVDQSAVIAPGASVDIDVSGFIPKNTRSGNIKIVYAVCKDKVTIGASRTQSFTSAGDDIESLVMLTGAGGDAPTRPFFGSRYILSITGKSFVSGLLYYVLSALSFIMRSCVDFLTRK